MFERKREYPAAVTPDELTADEADEFAVQWVLNEQAQLGGQVLLLYQAAWDRRDHPILDALEDSRGVVATTRRSLPRSGWTGGPVLAAWPDIATLGSLADNRRTSALCALTWNFDAIAPWAHAVGAQILGADAGVSLVAPTIEDPVVMQAMQTVTRRVNMNNTIKSGYEKSVVIGALRILRTHNHVLDAERLYTWSLANGWPARRAEELRDAVRQTNSGARPRVPEDVYTADAYSSWKHPGSDDEEE